MGKGGARIFYIPPSSSSSSLSPSSCCDHVHHHHLKACHMMMIIMTIIIIWMALIHHQHGYPLKCRERGSDILQNGWSGKSDINSSFSHEMKQRDFESLNLGVESLNLWVLKLLGFSEFSKYSSLWKSCSYRNLWFFLDSPNGGSFLIPKIPLQIFLHINTVTREI